MRDDNSQQQFEHDQQQEEWHEHQRCLLNGFIELQPIIKGKVNDKNGNNECAEKAV